jgi:ribose transport system ATP-binding protein
MSAACLKVEGLSKSFFGVPVLHAISFEVHAGEVLSVVGENGSGKSTTMNILAGVLQGDAGRILLNGTPHAPRDRGEADKAGVAFIQQELSIFANLTVAENLFVGHFPRFIKALPSIDRKRMRLRARELLHSVSVEIDPDVLAGTLSPGERQLVEIARALATEARVIIFDEPTTSLTHPEAERLFEIIARLKACGVAVIFISHGLEDVLRLADRIVVMRDGRVTLSRSRSGLSASDLIIAMVGRSIDALFPERPIQSIKSTPVLEVEGVSEPGVVADITFRLDRGEVVGLAGLMGSGRSELARILFGLDTHRTGCIRMHGSSLASGDLVARIKAGMAYLTEDRRRDGLMMEASVADNMALAALPLFARRPDGRLNNSGLLNAIRTVANQLNLHSGPMSSTLVRTLSGGNQQKVVLGRWLLRQPEVFILDEPTRGVDVGAKEEIYHLLARFASGGMAILVISSELEELIGLCDRILVMGQGRLRGQFQRAEFDREAILQAAFGEGRAA